MNKTATILTILVSIIGLLAFVTGKNALPDLLSSDKPANTTPPISQLSVTQPQTSPISFKDWLSEVSNEDQTDLQKSEFVKKHEGKFVTWGGYVRSVDSSDIGEMKFNLVLVPDSDRSDKWRWNFVMVLLPESAKSSLLGLNAGDFVEVTGLLEARSPDTPILSSSEIKKVKKLERQNEL